MIRSYPKGSPLLLTPNFNVIEFECPCDTCKETLVNPDLVTKLEAMRKILGSKLRITSGYRCATYQQQLKIRGYETAKGISQHTRGNAVDVTNEVALGAELEEAARKAGFRAVGVAKTWVHLDMRDDMDRRWFYSKR